MTRLAFVDTETTGLTMGRHPLWEVAIICREDGEDGSTDDEWMLRWRPDLTTAEPMALSMTGYWDRRPGEYPEVWLDGVVLPANSAVLDGVSPGLAHTPPGPYPLDLWTMTQVAELVAALTAGAHWVGAVPDFDAYRIDMWLREHGAAPAHHYHLVDIEPLMAGYLAGQAQQLQHNGPESMSDHARQLQDVARPPWRSKELAKTVGAPHTGVAHTAMDDARWARDCYDAVLGG